MGSFLLPEKCPTQLFFFSVIRNMWVTEICGWDVVPCVLAAFIWQTFEQLTMSVGSDFSTLVCWDSHWEKVISCQVSLLLPFWQMCARVYYTLSSVLSVNSQQLILQVSHSHPESMCLRDSYTFLFSCAPSLLPSLPPSLCLSVSPSLRLVWSTYAVGIACRFGAFWWSCVYQWGEQFCTGQDLFCACQTSTGHTGNFLGDIVLWV